ncbi:MAG: hypothetical protein WA661_22970, partial [Xanthobacteraceae bacterium]
GLREGEQIRASDLAAPQIGDVIAFNRAKNLSLRAPNFALRFRDVLVNHVAKSRIVVFLPFALNRARLAQLAFAADHPTVRGLSTVKGLRFPMHDCAVFLENDLRGIARGAVFPFPRYDVAHDDLRFGPT